MPGGRRRRRGKSSSGGVATQRATIAALEARLAEPELATKELPYFSDYPLSPPTISGLKDAGFIKPTAIQRRALVRALQGHDVLGAAETGSGKTLAFVIPVLELLYRKRWSRHDGVGAIIISPTRELALQTYQCFGKIAKDHFQMTAGLVIGGTTFEKEQELIGSTNVLVCTPGRLLQHMDETPQFDCVTVQILVLDEADRILDMGFARDMDAILKNLPRKRQTLLFSATQTKSLKDLARLSLQSPDYVSAHDESDTATPKKLTQAYMVCPLHKKLDVLYSFIRTHLKCKTLVFVSSCKQVRFLYETFRRFRPGIPLLPLFGKQKQAKRTAIFTDFSKKQAAVLIATDIAARGLDFPAVDWVVQLDCPEDTETYIHRVGRTARYNRQGKAMLVLVPSEVAMVEALEAKRVVLTKTEANTAKMQTVRGRLQGICAQDQDIKYLAQKSFVSYLRSVFLQGNKAVFDVSALDTDAYALALGLPNAPKVKFIKGKARKVRHDSRAPATEEELARQKDRPTTKFDKLRRRTFQESLLKAKEKLRGPEDMSDDEDADGILEKSSRQRHEEDIDEAVITLGTSKRQQKALRSKALMAKLEAKVGLSRKTTHKVFDEDGTAQDKVEDLAGVDIDDQQRAPDLAQQQQAASRDFEVAAAQLIESDLVDRRTEKERIKEKKRKRKAALREEVNETLVQIGGEPLSDSGEGAAAEAGDDWVEGYDGYELGMSDSGESGDEDGQAATEQRHRTKRRRHDPDGGMDLAVDEALALQLLQG